MAGGGPARRAPAGGAQPQRADHLRVRELGGLHPQPQPHAHHHRHGQEAEQDHRQHQPGIPNVQPDSGVHGENS